MNNLSCDLARCTTGLWQRADRDSTFLEHKLLYRKNQTCDLNKHLDQLVFPCQYICAPAHLNPPILSTEPCRVRSSRCQSKPSAGWMACSLLFSPTIKKDHAEILLFCCSEICQIKSLPLLSHTQKAQTLRHFTGPVQDVFWVFWNIIIKPLLNCSATWQLKSSPSVAEK